MNWALKYEHFRLKLFELESLHQNLFRVSSDEHDAEGNTRVTD
jgi:hypothetical protein